MRSLQSLRSIGLGICLLFLAVCESPGQEARPKEGPAGAKAGLPDILLEAAPGTGGGGDASGLDEAGVFLKHAREAQEGDESARAEVLATKALIVREAAVGEEHPDLVAPLHALGIALGSQAKYREAELALGRERKLIETFKGPDHPDILPTLEWSARFLMKQEKYGDAEPLLRRGVAIAEKSGTVGSVQGIMMLYGLGRVCRHSEKYRESCELLRRAGSLLDKADDSKRVGELRVDVLIDLSQAHNSRSQRQEGETCITRAVNLAESRCSQGAEGLLVGLSTYGMICIDQRRFAEAEVILRRAVSIVENSDDQELKRTFLPGLWYQIADCYVPVQRYIDADPWCRRAVQALEQDKNRDEVAYIGVLLQRAKVSASTGKHSEADALIRRVETILGRSEHSEQNDLVFWRYAAWIYEGEGRIDEAVDAMGRVRAILERQPEAKQFFLSNILLKQASLYTMRGDCAEAAACSERARSLRQRWQDQEEGPGGPKP